MTAASGKERVRLVTERFPFAVECERTVLNRMPEPAAALFGRKTKSAVCVLAARPFPFPYDASGSYPLSGAEEAQLDDLLRSYEWDPRLRGMIPVGWSAPRPGGTLSPGDEVLFDRFFSEPWQIAIVNAREAPACWFRGLDGALQAEPLRVPASGKAGWATVVLFAAAAVLLAALLLPVRQTFSKPHSEAAGIGLSVSDKAGQLQIRWKRDAAEIAQAAGADVEIDDGGKVSLIHLDPSLLQTGSLFYSRGSENASVRMVLERRDGQPLEEQASVSGPPAKPAVPALMPPPAAPDPAPAEPPEMPAPETRKPQRLEVRVRVQPDRGEADRTIAAAHPPQHAFEPPAAALPAPARPVIQAPALAVLPRTPAPLPLEQRPLAVAAGTRQPEAPRRGQLIWTGQLERRGVLQIEGRRATSGHLNGALPGTPANITVLPGELTATGLRLYTANPSLARRVEQPGPQNGWNPTEYVWDPLRAKEISVLEAPGKYNDWKHLVLRAEDRPYSVLVLKWEMPPSGAR